MTGLGTEGRAPAFADLDQRSTLGVVRAVVRGAEDVVIAVSANGAPVAEQAVA